MKKLNRILLVGMLVALVAMLSVPALAQEEREGGSGAPLIAPNFGADAATFNPILSNDGTSNLIIARIFPGFIGVDPDTGYFARGADNALVSDWSVSEDNLTYTFTLRDDFFWSDGVQMTSDDILYGWEATVDGTANVNGNLLGLLDIIENVEAPDPQTVVVTFKSPDCNSLDSAATLTVVPAHSYRALYPNFADMNESESNLNPEVSGSIYTFLNFRPGEQVTLRANAEYPDNTVVPAGYILKNVSDQTVQAEQFLLGELSFMGVPTARLAEFFGYVDEGRFQGHASTRANTRFLAFNLADPANPQPGTDEDGNIIDQGLHPVFGDVRVRQALNMGMNFDEINEGVFGSFGIQMATHSRPDDWAYPADIAPYPFDAEAAAALLEEAGWTDSDGDGVRECNGCTTAEAGTLLEFELLTNAGNTSQEALGVILQDQWSRIGAKANFQPIDFNILVDTFTAQTFDAVMIFWGFGFPFDPDGVNVTFGVENDVPGAGFNAGSYYNARVEELLDSARSLPGCSLEERAVLYGEVYNILKEESPWIWIGISQTLTVAQNNLEGWDPKPTASSETLWNEETFFIAP
jgi:peptide/nickel transport system substrate-binding protein